ncbi:hypothetical protein ACU4GD_45005 [Cupriavidus basilensis]
MTGPQKRLAAVSIGLFPFWATASATVRHRHRHLRRPGDPDDAAHRRDGLEDHAAAHAAGHADRVRRGHQPGHRAAHHPGRTEWPGKFVVTHLGLATQGPILVFAILPPS